MWDLSNMLVGWLIGRFGLFGLEKDVVHEPMLNLMGLILAALSLVFFFVSSVLNVSPAQDARGPSCEPREPEAPIEPEDEESMRYGQQASKVGVGSVLSCTKHPFEHDFLYMFVDLFAIYLAAGS